MEGFTVSDADLTVYIHPSKSNKVHEAILRQLSSMLFKFNEAFDGVVLAYDVNIQSKNAKILPGISPYFGVRLKAKLLLFSPKPGMLLEGKVAKLGKDTIHVIVLGFSSAAITFEDIREEFKYRIDRKSRGKLVSKSDKRHVIRAGSIIRFFVKSLDEEILHISGSLIPSNTGCVHWLSSHSTEDGPLTDRSSKKERKRKRVLEARDLGISDQGTLVSSSGQKLKSKRTAGDVDG